MPSTSIRINEHALTVLRELARKQCRPMQAVLHEVIDSYRRKKFVEEADTAFAAGNRPALVISLGAFNHSPAADLMGL